MELNCIANLNSPLCNNLQYKEELMQSKRYLARYKIYIVVNCVCYESDILTLQTW